MEQMKFKDWGCLLSITIMLLLLTANLIHSYYIVSSEGLRNGLYLVLLLVLIFGYGYNYKKSVFEKTTLIFFLCCLPSTLLYSDSLLSVILNSCMVLALPGGLVLGKMLNAWCRNPRYKNVVLFIFLTPLVYLFYNFFFNSSFTITEMRDATFIFCCYIPFLLFFKSKFKYVGIILLLCIILLSAKRSSVIFIGIITLSLILGETRNSKNKTLRFVGLIISLFILGYYVIAPLLELDSITIGTTLDRFNAIEDSGGAGRVEHYTLILSSFMNSDLGTKIIGHGPDAVSIFGMPAHSDPLEVLYDYGLPSLITYIIFWIILLHKGINYLRHNNSNKEIIYLLGVILGAITLTSVNCFITNPLYYILLLSCISFFFEQVQEDGCA